MNSIVPISLGEPITINISDPSPGNPINHTTTLTGRTLINSITFRYITSAAAPKRYPYILLKQNSSIVIVSTMGTTEVSPNEDIYVTAAPGYPSETKTPCEYSLMPLPRVTQFTNTFTIFIDAINIQAGDSLRSCCVLASYWKEN